MKSPRAVKSLAWLMAIGLFAGRAWAATSGDAATTATSFPPWSGRILEWSTLPPLSDPNGFASPFAGVSGDALLVAGGANFPEGKPWEGGKKVWHVTVYVLDSPDGSWRVAGRLPRPLAYGVSVTVNGGVLCIGGDDGGQTYSDTFLMRWDGATLTFTDYPPLPTPLTNAAGAVLGGKIYVLGGIDSPTATVALHQFLMLDLARLDAGWTTLDPWPGSGRMLPVVATLSGSLYLCSGANLAAGPDGKPARAYLKDAYRYTPGSGWSPIASMPRPAVAAPSPSPAFGPSNFLILGGDDGSLAGRPASPDHPGFPRTILNYQTVTGEWTEIPGLAESRVTVPTVEWRGRIALPNGEVRPGIRTPAVAGLRLLLPKADFGFLNFTTLTIYLLAILGIGAYWTTSNRTTDDYFRGGQRIPWWAAGLSIFATTLSSITFMAIPAKAYAENWVFIVANFAILLVAPFIVFYVMPIFRRIDATSAYEYLEKRFNLAARLFGAVSFLLMQLGRMAIVLYLPALALATVTDFDIRVCIALMGILSVVYCVIGGVSAVIWTDVAQSFVLLGGALVSLVLILLHTDGGIAGFIDVAMAEDKFKIANMTWDITVAALWVVVLGNLFQNLIPYMTDQGVVQRYMTTRDEKSAARSIWLNAVVAMPASVLFFLVGTALYVYFKQQPAHLPPGFQNDAIFPLFIAWRLPAGVAGLVVAGIFAAAQSTVSTSMNSMSTVLVKDFFRRLGGAGITDRAELSLAKWMTGILGVLGTLAALLLTAFDVKSLWDIFLGMLGLTGSSLAGLFLLGIFTRRVGGAAAMTGAGVSVVVLYIVQKHTPLHFFLYAATGTCVCCLVGWLASLILPAPPAASLQGLTIHSLRITKGNPKS